MGAPYGGSIVSSRISTVSDSARGRTVCLFWCCNNHHACSFGLWHHINVVALRHHIDAVALRNYNTHHGRSHDYDRADRHRVADSRHHYTLPVRRHVVCSTVHWHHHACCGDAALRRVDDYIDDASDSVRWYIGGSIRRYIDDACDDSRTLLVNFCSAGARQTSNRLGGVRRQ